MADPAVRVCRLSVGYGAGDILQEIEFEVRPNETVGLLGPNGSGKTTLLKAMCGALVPSGGSVEIDGKDVRSLGSRERARLVSYVPQHEDHVYDIKVSDLVLMGRLCRSNGLFETAEDNDAAMTAMQETDCKEFADRFVSTLSGGEAQRALVARSLAQETPVLLCDEPTTHLDPRHQGEIASLLRRLRNDSRAILVSSHDLNWALSCCDRCLLLDKGKLVFDGDLFTAASNGILDEVYETKFVVATVDGRRFLVPEGTD